jgi:hypothetical protein
MTIDVDFDPDYTGAPVLFAVRKPGQVAAQPDSSGAVLYRGAAAGNPNFDPVTGKFAGKKLRALQVVAQTVQAGAPPLRSGVPTGVDPLVWERRLDMVRDAARTNESMTPVTATAFLTGKVPDVTQVDIAAFLADVTAQRISDLADALDYKIRPRRDRPDVKVTTTAAWAKNVFNGLDVPQSLHLVKRLEGRGWEPDDIRKLVIAKIRDPERKAALEQAYGEGTPEPEEEKPGGNKEKAE